MQADMKMEDVLAKLRQLKAKGESLSKKKVKQSDPVLMRNALFYFPSWEHALEKIDA
ncbi:hypothetical protein [Ammoniphilus sp. YIM 78166]|uniref:hypothetical protein n=1 Tax=Ammoniphilus sp. YIM 78166 TaxID=1644106 RepID=UPI0014317440|nr:hypothetical protein [Ammoniphilus sp. YIM 78166]